MSDRKILLLAPPRIRDGSDVRFFSMPAGTTDLVIDLTALEWVSPSGVVAILALIRRAERDGVARVELLRPRIPEVREYLWHVGFVGELQALGAVVDEDDTQEPDPARIRACLPVTFVRNEWEMEQAANALVLTLMGLLAPPQVTNATYLLMTELTNNAWQHGSPCYVVAQTHTGNTSGTPGLHLGIADFGEGFARSLASYHPQDEAAAILLAFEEGISGTGDRARGLGLAHALDAVDEYDGSELFVVSHNAMVKRTRREFEAFIGPDCQGVFVSAYFPFTPDPSP